MGYIQLIFSLCSCCDKNDVIKSPITYVFKVRLGQTFVCSIFQYHEVPWEF